MKSLRSQPTNLRTVESVSISAGKPPTSDMKLRELADRIYFLLLRCTSPSGRSLIQILSEVTGWEPQQLFERIYQHLLTRHQASTDAYGDSSHASPYLVEVQERIFLGDFQKLREILALFRLHETFLEIPHYLRKRVSRNMIESLYEDIPRVGILYLHRHNPSVYQSNTITTQELIGQHFDGEPIPPYIQQILIHQIVKRQGYRLKIWELVPTVKKTDYPVCCIPSFFSNYYTFHYEGNASFDYSLVREGHHVFVLDHEPDQDISLEVYVEYFLPILLEFILNRTGASQVILGGHGFGGTLALFKCILDTELRPLLVSSIKALFLINSPIATNSYQVIPSWFSKASSVLLNTFQYHGFPLEIGARWLGHLPGASWLLTHKTFFQDHPFLGDNPFSVSSEVLTFLLQHGFVNPSPAIVKYLLKRVQPVDDESSSLNFEELYWSPDQKTQKKKRSQERFTPEWNYLHHVYRFPSTIPVLALQTLNDSFSPPSVFFRLWRRLPHNHKLKLNSYPKNFHAQEHLIQKISQFIQKCGPSSTIGITVQEGRHFDPISSEKRLIHVFLKEVMALPTNLLDTLEIQIKAHWKLLEEKNLTLEQQQQYEQDFSKKLLFLDPPTVLKEKKRLLHLLFDILFQYHSSRSPESPLTDFMQRDKDSIDRDDSIKYNLFYCCVHRILSLKLSEKNILALLIERIESETDVISAEGVRALIDLTIALYDSRATQGSDPGWNQLFERFLNDTLKHPESRVSLHALRAFFHTRDAKFVRKGRHLVQQLPPELQEKAERIYWNEIAKMICELEGKDSQLTFAAFTAFDSGIF